MKIILHIDLDSFYASVEEVRHPELRGKPLVICMFSGRGEGGAVATANYPARKLGIHSGQPLRTARARGNKDTTFLPANRELYKKVSDKVMIIFRKYADSFEQRSIDEAYLDCSSVRSLTKAKTLAQKIKQEILEKEKLTCSVGIGENKLVAKMASREQKPDGLTIVKEGEFKKFFADKPVEKLFGIGPKTLAILQKFRIKTIKDLSRSNKDLLIKEFGPTKGVHLYEHAHGRDKEPVSELIRQQLSRMKTLKKDTRDLKEILSLLSTLTSDLHRQMKKQKLKFRTVTLITINSYLDMKTRSKSLESLTTSKEIIIDAIQSLLQEFLKDNPKESLRRVGVRISSFEEKKKQKPLSAF